MNFAETMQAAAKKGGHVTIEKEAPPPIEKAGAVTKDAFAAALGAAAAAPTTVPNAAGLAPAWTERAFSDEFESGLVALWSFSGLKGFEQCQWRTKLHKVDGIAQESGEAAERGSMFHDMLEDWVRSLSPNLPQDRKSKMEAFGEQLAQLKVDFNNGHVTLEDKWGVRKDWSPCTWDDEELWGRGALDGFVIEASGLSHGEKIFFENGDLMFQDGKGGCGSLSAAWLSNPELATRITLSCRIIDYKTGRKFGNEMKHADQGLCYALHAMHRFPEVNSFQTEFWYLDQGVTTRRVMNRKQLEMLLLKYHNRARKMTETTNFIPAASVYNCIYCPYGSNVNAKGKPYGNGACGFDKYRELGEDNE